MAFVRVDKTRSPIREGEEEIRMGSHRGVTGRTVYLSISRAVIRKAGWTLKKTENGNRDYIPLAVDEGVGEDAGFWMLSEDVEHGYVLGTDAGKTQSFYCSLQAVKLKHYVLNDDKVSVHPVEFQVDAKDGSILIQCPDWLRYNPQSYKEPDKPDAPPLIEKKKETRTRPTLVTVPEDKDGDEDRLNLNRRQRRAITAALVKRL